MPWEFIDNHQTYLVQRIRGLLEKSNAAFMAVGFIRESGVDLLADGIKQMMAKDGSHLHVLFGSNFCYTQAGAVEKLRDLGALVRCYRSENEIYHPKCYFFRGSGEDTAIVGSSNLSACGLSSSREWSLLVRGPTTPAGKSQVGDLRVIIEEFKRLWAAGADVTPDIIEELRKPIPAELLHYAHREDLSNDDWGNRFDGDRHYVTFEKDWWFDLALSKLQEKVRRNAGRDFLVTCWDGRSKQLYFAIPYSHLAKEVFLHIEPYPRDKTHGPRYMLDIDPPTEGTIHWRDGRGGVYPTDGKPFMNL